MPGVRLMSDKMAEGIARLGTSALGVRSVEAPSGEHIADFTVLFATGGNAERFENMRAWLHLDEGLYLIPDDTAKGPCGPRLSPTFVLPRLKEVLEMYDQGENAPATFFYISRWHENRS